MKRLSAIQSRYWLLTGTLILCMIGYQLAFKPTLELWDQYRLLQQQLNEVADISPGLGYLTRKNINLDKIINTYKIDSVTFRDNAVNNISRLAESEQVKLTAVPPEDPYYHTPAFIVQKISFEGGFFQLLKLVHTLENTEKAGMLRSVTWRAPKQSPGNTNAKNLSLDIYMEACR